MAELAVVTVSYGDGVDLLARQAESLVGEAAVGRWIVVANGNGRLVRAAKLARAPVIVELSYNTGSAVGFAAGIEAALGDPSTDRVLLLDQDNLVRPGVIDGLLAEAGDAVAAYRPRVYWAAARGIGERRADSCLGFHVLDLPGKLWRRLAGDPAMRRRVVMPSAGYGGLMLRRTLLQRIGLPDARFVLYADDTEWTRRAGGITLATDLVVEEPDRGDRPPRTAGLRHWLDEADAFRLYYGVRNETYLDVHRLQKSRWVYGINRALVLMLLRLYSRGRDRQFALLREAMAAGEAGRLGPDPRFVLPETP